MSYKIFGQHENASFSAADRLVPVAIEHGPIVTARDDAAALCMATICTAGKAIAIRYPTFDRRTPDGLFEPAGTVTVWVADNSSLSADAIADLIELGMICQQLVPHWPEWQAETSGRTLTAAEMGRLSDDVAWLRAKRKEILG